MAQNAPSTQVVEVTGTVEAPGGAVPERPRSPVARSRGRLARVPDITSVVLTVVAVLSVVTALSIPGRTALGPVLRPLELVLPVNLPSSLSGAALFALLAAAAER